MGKIEIYSSKKKSLLLLIASLLFVIGGLYMFSNPESSSGHRASSPLFIKTIGIVTVLFFGLGIYVSIRRVLKNHLFLIIEKKGITFNPEKSQPVFIEWKYLNGFSELKIQSQKFVIINIDNSDYWIEKEESKIRKKLMRFNMNHYGSPFNLSTNSLQINHIELMKMLNENLIKYKNNA